MLGAINHVAITVTDLVEAAASYEPVLEFLGYRREEELPGLVVFVSTATGSAINLWQAAEGLRDHRHEPYAPGLHHLAFNADSRQQVDELHELLLSLNVRILNSPAEYDYAPGYYAVFWECADGVKLELAHIPGLQVTGPQGDERQ